MSDANGQDRPRPQFGEYASPEEQRAHIQEPQPAREPVAELPAVSAPPASGPPTLPPIPRESLWATPAHAPSAAARSVNRIVTVALLVYGAINVILSVFSFFDLPTVIDSTYKIMGVPGSFANVALARTWGIVAAIVLVVGYLATLLWSVRRMRRGRTSWWAPLVGAVVTYVVVSVCIAVPMMSDPTFVSFVSGAGN